jgi:cytochrome c oxidase subunit 2
MNATLPLWPEQASAHAAAVDRLTIGFSALNVLLTAPIFILIVVFAVRYRRGTPADRTRPARRNTALEVAWAAGPFVLILGFYLWSTRLFLEIHRPPADALPIAVVAKQWMWKFQHPGGQREINELHVPLGRAIRLSMTSEDVIHSLFIPALRLKQDVLPGRITELWFNADRPGRFTLTCTQFCGTDHAVMGGRLVVLAPQDYARWLAAEPDGPSMAAQGAALYRRLGCGACHDDAARAPRLAGLAGSRVALDGGGTAMADAQYLRDSILLPNTSRAAGYAAIMPSYRNLVTEEQLARLVAYLQSLAP